MRASWCAAARRLGGLVVALLATALLTSTPAQAADGIALSLDGTSWSRSLPGRIFPAPSHVAPGDVVVSALWVRNDSATRARVQLRAGSRLGSHDGSFVGDLTLTVGGVAVAGGATWRGPALGPGQRVRVPLVVRYSAAATSSGITAATVLESATLSQVGPDAGPAGPGSGEHRPPGGGLASTGLDAVRASTCAFVALAAGLVLVLVAARRRHQRDGG
jgi:hypothetical protein